MGTYCELVLHCRMRENLPQKVIDALKLMLNPDNLDPRDHIQTSETFFMPREEINRVTNELLSGPHHQLFDWEGGVEGLLSCAHRVSMGKSLSVLYYDERCNCYFLSVHCHMKFDLTLYELFVDWIGGFTDEEGFAGYMRFENEEPVLIYFDQNVSATLRDMRPIYLRDQLNRG